MAYEVSLRLPVSSDYRMEGFRNALFHWDRMKKANFYLSVMYLLCDKKTFRLLTATNLLPDVCRDIPIIIELK